MTHRTPARRPANRTPRHAVPFEAMERRQHFSASSVKAIDSGGPDFAFVEADGVVYSISSTASGAGQNQIWRSTGGGTRNSKLLVDASRGDSKVGSFENLTVTGDGKVWFTATTTGGRQIFQLTSTGYKQITKDTGVFYQNLTAVGSRLYFVEGNSDKLCNFDPAGKVRSFATGNVSKMFAAKGQLFYLLAGDGGLFRSDGSSSGTYRIDGDVTVSGSTIFASVDHLYFGGTVDGASGLWRSDGANAAPRRLATEFTIRSATSAQVGSDTYLSGYFGNGSPLAAGAELYKISPDGTLTAVTDLPQGQGGAYPDGIAAIGNQIYFTANDGDFVTAAGTPDRELWRYDAAAGTTIKITIDETLFPIETGGGVLTSYYFVAAPTKADSRFGSRRLYRTSPGDDRVEPVGGLPSYQDSNDQTKQDVSMIFAGSRGLFYSARNDDGTGGDYDTYFVATPFTYVDPVTNALVVEATASADDLTVKLDDDELVLTLDGVEERRALSTFGTILVNLKAGDDKLITDAAVTRGMDVRGDEGDDSITTGGGDDSLLGGAGRNYYFAGAGDDRVRGGNGYDYVNGGAGKDRLYGRGGSDFIRGENGVDFLYGDDLAGPFGNDTLVGDQSADKLYAYGGNDSLVGGLHDDSLFGGDGDDTLKGEDGDDTLEGGNGIDQLLGHAGDDAIFAKDSALDVIDGGAGDDRARRDNKEKGVKAIEALI